MIDELIFVRDDGDGTIEITSRYDPEGVRYIPLYVLEAEAAAVRKVAWGCRDWCDAIDELMERIKQAASRESE